MASIGIYDIDFWHGRKTVPNLELMKVFNYFYQKKDVVVFVSPKDNLERFNTIYYFKDSASTIIPRALNLSGDNKILFGYGFYRTQKELKPEIKAMKPNYLPYDLNEDKNKSSKLFNKIKQGSLIRIATNDFSDFKEDTRNIYVTDRNVLYEPKLDDFLKEYKKYYDIHFLHQLAAADESTAKKYFSLANAQRRIVINFKPSPEFFKKYYYERVMFQFEPYEYEKNPSVFLQRIIQMILYAKANNKLIYFGQPKSQYQNFSDNSLMVLAPMIYKWANNKTTDSFYDFIDKNEHDKINNLIADKRKLRLLLKQNPLTFDTENIDFLTII